MRSECVFACENDPVAQSVLRRWGIQRHLAEDVTHSSTGYLLINEHWHTVSSLQVDVLLGGTSCTSISTENAHSNSECMADGSGSSGTTFSGALDLLTACGAQGGLLENVQSIMHTKQSSGSKCVTAASDMQGWLREAGYKSAPHIVDSQQCGEAQRRNRTYIPFAAAAQPGQQQDSEMLSAVTRLLEDNIPGSPIYKAPSRLQADKPPENITLPREVRLREKALQQMKAEPSQTRFLDLHGSDECLGAIPATHACVSGHDTIPKVFVGSVSPFQSPLQPLVTIRGGELQSATDCHFCQMLM